MSKTNAQPPPILPHLPNELRIRILSFIDDPQFLWTTCRKVSPAFKLWSEEQYARKYLGNMKLEMHLTPPDGWVEGRSYPNPNHVPMRTEFVFGVREPSDIHASRLVLKPDGPPCSVVFRATGRRPARNMVDADFAMLDDLARNTMTCQVQSEMALGLRPTDQAHVCPCRSLRDHFTRRFCERYIGAERYFGWDAELRTLEVQWKDFLDYVHERKCRSPSAR